MTISKKLVFLITLALFLLVACTGSKKMVNKARKLEEAGLTKDAAEFYYDGLVRNPNNTDAIIGLKKTGQLVLDEKLQKFYKANSMDAHKEAVYSYLEATKYRDKVKKVNVELDFPSYYQGYYDKSKNIYLHKRYEEGNSLIEEDQYEKAEKIFDEILAIDPEYKDASELESVAYVEPFYRRGLNYMDAEKFRSAYNEFNEVLKKKPSYKDASQLRDESLEYAIFTIAIMPSSKRDASNIATNIVTELGKSKNPFVVVVDRQNTDKLIAEQKLALSGAVDDNSAAQAGKLLGVKAVMFVNVSAKSTVASRPVRSTVVAWKKVKVRKYDAVSKTHKTTYVYKRTSYTKIVDRSAVDMSFDYRLVSSETGEVLASGAFNEKSEDAIQYAVYSGSYRDLYPTSSGYQYYSQKKSLDRMFTSKKSVKSVSQLTSEVSNKIATKVSKGILKYETSRQ